MPVTKEQQIAAIDTCWDPKMEVLADGWQEFVNYKLIQNEVDGGLLASMWTFRGKVLAFGKTDKEALEDLAQELRMYLAPDDIHQYLDL